VQFGTLVKEVVVEGTTLHRVEEGSVSLLLYLDEAELDRLKHLMYYCDECAAYHIRDASTNMGEFVRLLNQEVESA